MAASPFYQRMAATATRLIDKFDQDEFYVISEVATPNPNPLLPPSIQRNDIKYKAVAFGTKASLRASDPELSDASMYVLIDTQQGYMPKAADRVIIGGRETAIIRVEPIPAMSDCVYKFYVR